MLPDRTVIGIVFRHELRANARTALVWFGALGAMVGLVCVLQPALAAGPLAAKIASLPDAMRDVFGLRLVDFNRPAAYLATNFTYIALGTTLFGALLGARVIAKEEVHRTAEMLYTQPIGRAPVIAGKALAVTVYTIALPAALGGLALALLGAIVPRPLEPLLVTSLFVAAACAALLFAGLGLLLATLVRNARGTANLALGLVLGTFVVGALSAMTPNLAPLRWLSPHKLVEAPSIVARGGFAPVVGVGLLLLGGICALLAARRYRSRDIHA